VTDNSINWRFQAELAEQLILLLELYSLRDVYAYLCPIAVILCANKVSSICLISYMLVSEMLKKLHREIPMTFRIDFIDELVDKFGRCPKWSVGKLLSTSARLSLKMTASPWTTLLCI
jgi:serine/threonine-protein phosphatase 4 regulatory subunit 1